MDYLQDMWQGRGHLRFFIQPALAIVLGILDGRQDARLERPPYVFELLRNSAQRKPLVGEALKRLSIPLALGVTFSLVFQWIIRKSVNLGTALLYGVFFIGLPYAMARALSNRASKFHMRRTA